MYFLFLKMFLTVQKTIFPWHKKHCLGSSARVSANSNIPCFDDKRIRITYEILIAQGDMKPFPS